MLKSNGHKGLTTNQGRHLPEVILSDLYFQRDKTNGLINKKVAGRNNGISVKVVR